MTSRLSALLLAASCVLVLRSADARPWGLEVRGGALRFTDSLPQNLYGTWAPEGELEGYLEWRPWLLAWANLNGAWRSGESLGLNLPTHLSLYTGSLGVKFALSRENTSIKPYLGGGLSAGLACTKDQSLTLPETTSKWSLGGVVKSGLLFYFSPHFFSDIFLDYYYQPISTPESAAASHVDVGGLRVGLGIGVHF